jgi:hypothetical protein
MRKHSGNKIERYGIIAYTAAQRIAAMRHLLYPCFMTALLVAIGCGAAGPSKNAPPMAREGGAPEAKKPEAADAAAGQPDVKEVAPVQRKIIYTATLNLIVEDFQQSKDKLDQLVKEEKGAFVAKSDVSGSPGSRRSGYWTVRIPVDQLEPFMAEVAKLGELQNTKVDSQDVTAEYYDVATHIKNKKVEEERLIEHLKNSTGKLEQILAVEREISRVRGEIERLQGRLNVLANLSSLSTVNIHISERKDYVPETAAGFGTTIGRTFSGSVNVLLSFGKALVLVAVALVPWLPLLALVFGVPIWLFRRWLRKNAVPTLVAVEAPAAVPPVAPVQ